MSIQRRAHNRAMDTRRAEHAAQAERDLAARATHSMATPESTGAVTETASTSAAPSQSESQPQSSSGPTNPE